MLRISGEICRKRVTDCKRVQRGVDWGCWKFKGFVPQLVPKIDRTGAKEYFKLYSLSSNLASSPERTVNGGPGRPKYEIDEETLLHFRALEYKCKDIAELLLVSRWTLRRRVRELGISEETGFTIIGNTDFDDIVRAFMNIQEGLVGYSVVRGHLRSMGINVQRERIRASISRVDPMNCRLKWATVVSRRAYSVPGPNSLWHRRPSV